MFVLILGLILFLGAHSVRLWGEDFRDRMIAERGDGIWKGVYSLASVVGIVLIVWGYGLTRLNPIDVWYPPIWTRHLAILLNAVAFALVALNGSTGPIRAAVGHPMVLGVKVWAFAHLLANGRLGDILLFGAFMIWAIVDYAGSRRRDKREGVVRMAGPWKPELIRMGIGLALWLVFLLFLHQWLFGVSPLG
ncbi:putative membrane protein [Rhodopseudomonas julia]|uniref:Membrane protein n=1 Tax=Rhodopseudomonas julia TaxID=200617 RepID=A0ABU0C7S2_9BRAD|nr:NnrU family protein [Rhodopseudomonas julia]MDQ0326561.1 putative membrane protein [Rhodopseudomonas julia]